MAEYFTGDTIRPRVTFRDWAPEGSTGSIVDPSSVNFRLLADGGDTEVVGSTAATKESNGIYYYDVTLPEDPGTYCVEFTGTLSGMPHIIRANVKVKFKAST